MCLLLNLFTVLDLTSRPHGRPLFAVAAGFVVAGRDKMPKYMFYVIYALRIGYLIRFRYEIEASNTWLNTKKTNTSTRKKEDVF